MEMGGHRGRAVVAAAFASAMVVYGITHSFGVVFEPMAAAFGAGRGATAVVFSFTIALLFLLGPVTGPLADRHGPRPLVLAGTALLVCGLLLTAVVQHLWLAYLTYGAGVGVAGACFLVPMTVAVGGWFERGRTIALGIAATGIGAGTLVMPPLVARLIAAYGFRQTCVILAIAAAVLLPICALGAHRPPRRADHPPARSLRDIAQLPGFVPLHLSCAALTCSVIMLSVALVPYARERGLSPGAAALLLSVVGGASVCGRLALGAFGARWALDRQYRACVAVIALALGGLWLGDGGHVALIAGAVLFGGAQGGWVALTPAVTLRLYGTADAGRVLGLLYTGQGLGGFIGPLLAGLLIARIDGVGTAVGLAGLVALGAWLLLGAVGGRRRHEIAVRVRAALLPPAD
jgi:MFS family permease